jgi:DNA-binding transcriptional LysR family regulator
MANSSCFCSPCERSATLTLQNEPLITLTRDSGIRLLVEVAYESVGIPLVPAYEVSQITTALALVEARLGVAVLPTYARAAAPHRRILARPLTNPAIARDIVMIRPRGRSVSPALATFETVLRRHVRRLTPADID